MHTIDPTTAAETTAAVHALPTGRTAHRAGTAHVFLDSPHGLAQWLDATGGYTTCRPAGTDVVLWTLHTHTGIRGDGTATPILVHTLALEGVWVPERLTAALA